MCSSVSLASLERNARPAKIEIGMKTKGTTATGPAIMAITTTNIKANGASAKMNKVDEVMKLRTISKCRICAANVPTVRGRWSMRMASAWPKNTPDSSSSMALQAFSTKRLRTWRITSSNTMAMSTPTVSTQSVENPCVGTTRS